MFKLKDKLVAENDKSKFYSNSITETFASNVKYQKLGLSMLLAELKDTGEEIYILCQKGEVVFEHSNVENIAARADVIVLSASM